MSLKIGFEISSKTPAAPILKKACSGEKLSHKDLKILLPFVALQDVRNPARWFEFRQRAEQTLPEIMNSILLELKHLLESGQKREAPTPSARESALFPSRVFTETDEYQPTARVGVEMPVSRSLWLGQIRHTLTITYKVLLKHKWTILRPAIGWNWFTSDRPLVRLNYYKHRHYDFNGGWNSRGSEILFPLSPKYLLYTQIDNPSVPQHGSFCSPEFTLLVRKIIAENAYRYIYSHYEDPLVAWHMPRIVNREKFIWEQKYWNQWHSSNVITENEFASR